jgi:Insertion element 4 transposase N-terminal
VLLYSASPVRAIRPGQSPTLVAGPDGSRDVPAGMIAVPAGQLCAGVSRIAGGRQGASATTVAGGGLAGGQQAVFAAPVVSAPVVRRRDGRVQADGHPGDHARLMLLEDQLPAGLIEDLVTWYGVREERRRGLTAAMAVRCVLMMVLLPNAGQREVMATVAGRLADVPWARPWQVPGGEVLSRHRSRLGSALFVHLFTVVAQRNAADAARLRPPPVAGDRPAAGWLGDLLLCSGDGVLTRVPDGASREEFTSIGTGDDSSPYPQLRAVVVTVCATRALLGAAADGCQVGEQTLTRRIVTDQPWVFTAGRCYLFDRNFLGATLIEQIVKANAHVLMRMKAGIELPNLGWLPDGSYRSQLRLPDGRSIPVRVVDYDVVPPGEQVTSGELFCLAAPRSARAVFPAERGEIGGRSLSLMADSTSKEGRGKQHARKPVIGSRCQGRCAGRLA